MSSIRETAEEIADGWLRGEKNNDELVDAIEQALKAERNRNARKSRSSSQLPGSITETAERICRHNLDSERVSVTQFSDTQTAIEQALRNERERAAKMLESRANELQAEWDAPPSVDNGLIVMTADTPAGYATWWGMNELRKRAATIRKDD